MERFHLVPSYYPAATRDILPLAIVLRHGALPLGYKTRYRFFRATRVLNVGLVEPKRLESAEVVESAARAAEPALGGVAFFAVDPDEYVTVLKVVYGLKAESLRALPPGELLDSVRERL